MLLNSYFWHFWWLQIFLGFICYKYILYFHFPKSRCLWNGLLGICVTWLSANKYYLIFRFVLLEISLPLKWTLVICFTWLDTSAMSCCIFIFALLKRNYIWNYAVIYITCPYSIIPLYSKTFALLDYSIFKLCEWRRLVLFCWFIIYWLIK